MGAVADLGSVGPMIRVANALVAYLAYLAKTVWPIGLSVFYPYTETLRPWATGGALVLLVVVSLVILRSIRAHPAPAVGWFWYLVTLLPYPTSPKPCGSPPTSRRRTTIWASRWLAQDGSTKPLATSPRRCGSTRQSMVPGVPWLRWDGADIVNRGHRFNGLSSSFPLDAPRCRSDHRPPADTSRLKHDADRSGMLAGRVGSQLVCRVPRNFAKCSWNIP